MPRYAPFLVLFALLFACAASGQTPSDVPEAKPQSGLDDYRIIWTRNMFARNRSSAGRDVPAVSPSTAKTPAEETVLTGVAVRGDGLVAFFENSRTGETLRVAVGQTIAQGTLVSISLDGVEYSSGGVARAIRLGESVSGGPATLSSSSASSTPAGATSANGAAPPGDAAKGSNDVLERMRQRRLQEMKK